MNGAIYSEDVPLAWPGYFVPLSMPTIKFVDLAYFEENIHFFRIEVSFLEYFDCFFPCAIVQRAKCRHNKCILYGVPMEKHGLHVLSYMFPCGFFNIEAL